MEEEKKDTSQQLGPPVEQPSAPRELNSVERFYERFRNVPLKYLDRFIAVCVAALVLVILLGLLDSLG